jgi:hypothetical protein
VKEGSVQLVIIMYLLQSVEQKLGLIDTWPTYIIQYPFVDVPSAHIVKVLSAFFFGNDVPVYIVTQLYRTCNYTCNIHATNYMYQLYLHWQPCMNVPSVYKFHMLQYYMLIRKHFWINGKCFYNQGGEIYSEMNTIQLDIENTGCNLIIRNTLRDVRLVMLKE